MVHILFVSDVQETRRFGQVSMLFGRAQSGSRHGAEVGTKADGFKMFWTTGRIGPC